MISIVVHGIMGTAYRQDIVVDGGAVANGDVKVLHDIRTYLSKQYGDGTPTKGWALSAAPSGMWLNRVERAFDINYAPTYLVFSFLIPQGKRLNDETVLNRISKTLILNHSRFISQNVIQAECDWSFLKPLSHELEDCLVPDAGAVSKYTALTDGEVACYQGDLSQMMREMWNGSFARYGMVFCGRGLLSQDKEYPIVNELAEQLVVETIEVAKEEPNVTKHDETDDITVVEDDKDEYVSNNIAESDPNPNPDEERHKSLKRILLGLLAFVVAFVIFLVIGNPDQPETDDGHVVSEVFKVNGVSFAMNRVEGGGFMMGADSEDDKAKDWEKPQHWVTLDGYYIGETEVTQELWEAVMNDNPSQFYGKQNPVESVSYDDCLMFVQKLNDKTGKKFRLPTEAEWEFAARGGIHSKHYKYAGSDNIDDVAWYWRNSGDDYISWDYCSDSLNSLENNHHCQTHPVKRKQPNELGLYDMTGNVIEWCSDWYGRYSANELHNPCGPNDYDTDKPMKVRRGGYYLQSAVSSRNTYRMYVSPRGRHEWLGFRLALSAAELD